MSLRASADNVGVEISKYLSRDEEPDKTREKESEG